MLNEWLLKRKLQKQLQGCNYQLAQSLVLKNFTDKVIPKQLAVLLDSFVSNPCFNTQVPLITYDPKFLAFFELSKSSILECLTKQFPTFEEKGGDYES
jgi:hypothetical protein